MPFKEFLEELGQLIHHRSVISCVYPKLVALEAVNELTTLNCAYPGLISTSGAAVRVHLEENQHPAVVFVTEHLVDGSGLELIEALGESSLDHRAILILTHNHALSTGTLESSSLSGIVLDHNIGGPTCVLVEALRAVNRHQRFIDPELKQPLESRVDPRDTLTDRELEVLNLVADGMSNREVATQLFLAPTTVRDHVQSVMRKLNVRSRTAAAVAGLKQGLLASS